MAEQLGWTQRVQEIRVLGEGRYEVTLTDDQGTQKVVCTVANRKGLGDVVVDVQPDIFFAKEPARIFARDLAAAVVKYHQQRLGGSEPQGKHDPD
jgi:hypothetical protein